MKKNKNKSSFQNKIILIALLCATLFMGVGYAAVNSVALGIGGTVTAIVEEKIYIKDAYYKEGTSVNEADSEILSVHKTLINGNVKLSDTDPNSSITYTLEIFNDTRSDQLFRGVKLVDDFYSNSSIPYSLSGLEVMDIVTAGDTIYVDLIFSYDSEVTPSSSINELEYYLEFIFVKYKKVYSAGDFEYNEGVIEYIVEETGKYFMQVWGAKGGNASGTKNGVKNGGAGGYSEGYVNLTKGESLFLIIGGAGRDIDQNDYLMDDGKYDFQYTVAGGYNGGGTGYSNVRGYVESPGGGATHVARNNYRGELFEYVDHKEDILIVAGGGGGANYENASWNCSPGGAGGGLTSPNVGHGGNGIAYGASTPDATPGTGGSFGQGANGSDYPKKLLPGGGGGYYGGGFVTKTDGTINSNKGSSGGSGYIGGTYDGNSIAGNTNIPTYDGSGTMVGNVGDGYAKIVLVEIFYE